MKLPFIIAWAWQVWPQLQEHGVPAHGTFPAPSKVKKKRLQITCYLCIHALPGATANQSKLNLQQWLDNTIVRMSSHDPLVYTSTGMRQWGLYHELLLSEFINITSVLSSALNVWGTNCVGRGWSCGQLYYLVGTGTGRMTISQQMWGPFK